MFREPLPASRWAALLVAAFVLSSSAPVAAQDTYDIVLENGRVMDPETGLDAVRNVGIRGSVIEAISEEPLTGDVVVDATGLVVAPGFIDLHAHGQGNTANGFQARDGVTTALEMEGGVPDVAAFLQARGEGSVLNFGATMSHGAARTWAMSQHAEAVAQAAALMADFDEEDAMEIEELTSAGAYDTLSIDAYPVMEARLQQGLAEGALGIGMPHQYYPGATHAEIVRVFQKAAELDAPIFTHVRDMGIAPIQEVVANAAATGAPLHIVHVNSSALWNIDPILDLIGGAQARGVDVTTEAYPYTAASTSLQSAIFDDGWQERLKISYGDLQWQDTGERLTEETFKSYRAQGGIVIIHMMKPEWIEAAVSSPFVMVASDGMPYAPGAHPRSAGTFARFLGRYVRDQELMTLMEGLAKITIMPAERLEGISPQMKRKGRLQIGSDADITVF
ncbi:MAG: amidohydrolase family protein, partial [Longimicrobiales bacterium]